MIKLWCSNCKTYTDFDYVDSSEDPVNGWKVGAIKSQGGCRDSRADYNTVKCTVCKEVHTADFATD